MMPGQLNCRAWSVLVTAIVVAGASPSAIQQPATDAGAPEFASVSVKPSASESSDRGGTRLQPDGTVLATNVTLKQLVEFAYQRHPLDEREVTGGPAWVASDRFDVVAKPGSEPAVDPDGASRQAWSMLRSLLERRFKLKVREEKKDRSVYALIMATPEGVLGPKMRKTEIDCGAVMKGQPPAMPPGHGPPCGFKTPPGRLFANTVTMATVASLMSRHVDRPVIDRTGLKGRFDIQLEAAELKPGPDYKPGPSDRALPPAAGPSIFVAVREQLGLKLEPQTALIPILVIEHVEPPVPD